MSRNGFRSQSRGLSIVVAVILALAACGAGSALADNDPGGEEGPSPFRLTPQLIEEANESPTASLEAPATDLQAAHQLPHNELDRAEARDLLTSVFGEEVEAPAGIFDALPEAKFLAANAAVMPAGALASAVPGEAEAPKEPDAPVLLESSLPLRIENEKGEEAPVDLSLEHAEGELQPVNPVVGTGIPSRLGEGVSLANGDVELDFPSAASETVPSTVEGDVAFYPNVEEDADLVVAPTPGGVETMTQLRTAEAPTSQTVSLSLPEGATLGETQAGGAEATLNGRQLLYVPPVSAIDAAGQKVPASLAVSGHDLEVSVSPGPQASYPILIDPNYIVASYNWAWGGSPLLNSSAWFTGNSTPTQSYRALWYSYPTLDYQLLDITSGFPGGASPTQGAGWEYDVPRAASDRATYHEWPKSWIENVTLGGWMFLLEVGYGGSTAPYPMAIVGVIDPEHGAWVNVGSWNATQGEVTGWAGVWRLAEHEISDAKVFDFSLAAEEYETQAKYRTTVAATAEIELRDKDTPTFKTLSGPEGWWNTGEPAIAYAANDPGLGVYKLTLTPPGGSPTTYPLGCVGDAEHPCPRDYKSSEAGSAALKVTAAGAPEGVDTYKAAVFDPLYLAGSGGNDATPHMSEGSVPIQIDHSAPTLALSGTLAEQASLGTAKPQYILKYNAADGVEEVPTYIASYGSEGSGNAQFKHPADVSRDGAGNMWVADENNNRIEKLKENGEFLAAYSTLTETDHLNKPTGIEVDGSGNVWVVDCGNNRLVEFNSKGEWMRKVGHLGSGNGEFSAPQGIAIDSSGNVWVADTGNNRIQELSSTGAVIRAFGKKGSGAGELSEPTSLDIGPANKVWVADAANNRVEEFSETGGYLAAYGSLGSGNGQLNHPDAIEVDSGGSVWVADQNNGRVEQLSERGEYLGQFGAKGTGPGQFTFSGPTGLTTNKAGSLWVVDSGDNRIERWSAPQGTRSGLAKVAVKMDGKAVQEPSVTCPQGGCPLAGEWTLQSGEYAAGPHTVEVSATDGVGLTKTEKLGITLNPPPPSLTLSGTLTEQGSLGTALPHYGLKLSASAEEGNGVAQAGRSTIATEITIDGKQVDSGEASCATETCPIAREWTVNSGEYAAGSHTVIAKATDRFGRTTTKELKITLNPPAPSATLSGTVTEQATLGTTRPRYILKVNATAEEGTGVSAAPTYTSPFGSAGTGNGQFAHPAGIAIDSSGNLWVADTNNNRVEEFSEAGSFVKAVGSTGAGNGQFSHPKSIAIDPKGDFWVADSGNSRLEEFSPSWEFLKAFGSSGAGNGQFSGPEGVAIDAKGNVWVADTYNHRVQELNEKGEFLKVVSGLGAIEPTGLAVGPGGNVWVADWAHNRVVEISESGTLLRSFGSEGTGNGQFKQPDVVAVDPSGNVWVGDQNNARVQEFNQSGEYLAKFGAAGTGAGQFSFSYPMGIATDGKGNIWVSDTNNNRVQRWRQATRSRVMTEVTIDGKAVDSGEATCPTETCPISREWTLESSAYAPGPHTLVAKATDGYGQWTAKTRTIEIQRDTTKPTLQLGGELANAPEGWIQQESYGFNTTATDVAGYGVTSVLLKIDGESVALTSKPCPEGGCEAAISKGIDMAPYSGGSHEAEVIATDGAGNASTKRWTINVDPEGHISTSEATATLEAVEETSDANLVGESEKEEIEGTAADLGLETTESGFAATGSLAPMTLGANPNEPMIVDIPEASELYSCGVGNEEAEAGPGEELEEVEPVSEEEECISASEVGDAELEPVSVTPLDMEEGTGALYLVEENAAISPNTESSVDTVVRPLDDGGMVFEAIRSDAAPEAYSYRVTLGPTQELEQIDSTHVEVAYSNGFPAFSISAEPAHDAVGTAVPTTLEKTGEDIVTLTIHYKEGHEGEAFVYPVLGGTGWEGGFHTYAAEFELTNPEEQEGVGSESGGVMRILATAQSAPSASASALEAGPLPVYEHHFKFNECRYQAVLPDTNGGTIPPEERRTLERRVTECLKNIGEHPLLSAISVHGYFEISPGFQVRVHNPVSCDKWGPDQPARVHCGKDRSGWVSTVKVWGNFRFPPGKGEFFSAPLTAACVTVWGTINREPKVLQQGDSVISPARAAGPESPESYEPCHWPW